MSIIAKICGITTPEALNAAVESGADYIGFVFFPKSPRHLNVSRAKELAALARGRVKIAALTVDASDERLQEIVDAVAPDVLQLHGSETPERVEYIKRRFGLTVFKAIAVATAEDAEKAREFNGVADLILFDAKGVSGVDLPGGNGRTFDWSALDGLAGELPFMLSGGLDADNVAAAIARTRPTAVDVSSGVEKSPGVKDPERIRRFLRTVKIDKQT
jgi:phosphoribosylanthranilate isomerase